MKDTVLLQQLKKREAGAYDLLYKFYYPMVEKFVLRNSGCKEDAEDIFQETLIVLYKKLPTDDFELTSSLKTYIFSISSNLWLKRLRKAKSHLNYLKTTEEEQPVEIRVEIVKERTWSEKLDSWISTIPLHCQKIIRFIFFLNPGSHVPPSDMGYKNPHTASNQKYKCMMHLKKAARKNNF